MTDQNPQTRLIELAKIDLPKDARQHTPEKLQTLVKDMKQQGQLQEIVVVSVGKRYEVVAGAGRVTAARQLRWPQIRASVREGLSEFEKARITFAENEDREDVDPFYQAAQIQRMLKSKNCSRKVLGSELGISDALIDAYVAIDGLPPEIRAIPKRLGIGQLIQIARLNKPKSQIALAEKCRNQDLSVRQLKEVVDRMFGKSKTADSKSPSTTSMQDPLATFWSTIQNQTMVEGNIWAVDYGAWRPPSMPGAPLPTWHFHIANLGTVPKADLRRWFLLMSEALKDTVETAEDGTAGDSPHESEEAAEPLWPEVPLTSEMDSLRKPAGRVSKEQQARMDLAIEVWGPQNSADRKRMEEDRRNVRIPKGREEVMEIQRLAARGPSAVYAWLYGPKCYQAEKSADLRWEDFEVTDPIQGAKDLVTEAEVLVLSKAK